MSQSSALFSLGQAFLATEFPATIKIGMQSYAAATSGLRSGMELADFGAVAQRTIAFWMPSSALAAAGQPLPSAGANVECTAPAALAGIYTLDAPVIDPTGTTLTLRCLAPAQ
jgi:hypothetical protein